MKPSIEILTRLRLCPQPGPTLFVAVFGCGILNFGVVKKFNRYFLPHSVEWAGGSNYF